MTQENQVLYEEEIEQIDKVLTRLIKEAEAKCALLVDKDGHLITRQGFTHTLDTTALAALLAGSFASTKEIARLVGEPEFSVLFHQGKRDHIHISLIGERTILVVIFDDRTTIGMVRLYAKEIGESLREILNNAGKSSKGEGLTLDEEFSSSAEDKLDDIFQD
ncbi:MAG: roadblock/LC7 domain-containing protein [candidate division Zixibacteria bacterium]|nr:roadblock/LC7 domain-containing protein [candidate division Zixibacteria bacterium]